MTWEELRKEWESDNVSLQCRTSGSTGKPKEILLPKNQVTASARRTIEFFGLNSSSHLHSCLAPDYIGGKMMMIRALECGATFTWETPTNRPLDGYEGESIDLLCVVPSQLLYIVQNAAHLPSIKAILVGGSPVPENLRISIADAGMPVWETYGMTETASHIAIRRVTYPAEPFTPLKGIRISQNEECLRIDIEGWKTFMTNDIVNIDRQGRFTIIGRRDNVIITGGLKVHPESVEGRLQPHLPFPVMITSVPDEKWGRRIVLRAENPTIPEIEIMGICRKLLQRHEIPKEIETAPIPRTNNGKIKRS